MKKPFPLLQINVSTEVLREWSEVRKKGEFRFIWSNLVQVIPFLWFSLFAMAGLYSVLARATMFGVLGVVVGMLSTTMAVALVFHVVWLKNERYFIGSGGGRA